MQLFITSADPVECAQALDDKRLNKIITESAQVICTVLAGDGFKGLPFKPTHDHHPIVLWAGETNANLYWTCRYHIALHDEWLYRGGRTHASRIDQAILSNISSRNAPKAFINAAKNESLEIDFTWVDDVFMAYQMYLTARWMNDRVLPKWKRRNQPEWFNDHGFSMDYINRAKHLIGKKKNGIIPCPRCGNELEYKDENQFKCIGKDIWYPCLLWTKITK